MKSKLLSAGIFLFILLITSILNLKCKSEDKTGAEELTLLNVSYDPTREMYQEFNETFKKYWFEKTGQQITINQSHGGSGKQARAVIDGLEADVVTLALGYDIDIISQRTDKLSVAWQRRLPNNSSPYTSTFVFLVRKGNPKNIKDWGDLIKDGVTVITPNPKTSGAARWNYLAAWVYAKKKFNGNEAQIRDFMKKLIKNVPVWDSGARASTNTFVQRKIGDVLIGWENEALLIERTLGKGEYEIVVPSVSMLAEPPVAYIDKVVRKKGTLDAAKAYLEFLYSEEGQNIVAKHYFRPANEKVMEKFSKIFKDVKLFTIADEFGSWKDAQYYHFDDNAMFDQLLISK
jgi:sulfate/thiosulfate transport system substrate-binding protein